MFADVCWPAGSAHGPRAEHRGMDSSQCVCNHARTGECDCTVQEFGGELAEGLFRDANCEGESGFSLKRYFVEISLLQSSC